MFLNNLSFFPDFFRSDLLNKQLYKNIYNLVFIHAYQHLAVRLLLLHLIISHIENMLSINYRVHILDGTISSG